MTEAPTPPHRNDDDHRRRPAPGKIMSTPVFLQNGTLAPIEQAVELAVTLDHLKRANPELLTRVRDALVESRGVRAEADELATLHAAGLTTPRGTPLADITPVALAMLRGAAGQEVVENPFVDYASRALFDYLRNEVYVAMLFDPHEVKAVHENRTVIDLMDAAPDASWVGYIQGRGKGPELSPDRN